MILVREAKIVDRRVHYPTAPGLFLMLESCVAGVWRTTWIQLDEARPR